MQAGGVPVTGDGPFVDPRWRWPEYAPGSVVEVLVHGVGGEGPEQMTRDPHPVRVGGDDGVGFWRARNPTVAPSRSAQEEPAAEATPGHAREVVSWGGSTSGGSRSAFWVLLLPFALFNAAGRMARPGGSRRTVTIHQATCRLLALSMTLGFVSLTMAAVVDIVALQCGAQPVCAEADLAFGWVLAPLRWFPDDAAALVALVSLVPIVAVYLLRLAGRRQLTDVGHRGDAPALSAVPAQQLHEPDFWANRWPAWRLRGLHITAGYAWAALVLGLVLPPLLPDVPSWLGPVGVATALASLVGNSVVVGLPRVAGSASSDGLATAIILLRAVTLLVLGTLVGTALSLPLSGLAALADGWVLGLVAGAAMGWSFFMHLRNVVAPGSASAGPSGAVRDLLLFGGTLAVAVAIDPAGSARVATADALGTLTASTGAFDWLLSGAPGGVYVPLLSLAGVQALLVVALLFTSVGVADRGAPLGDAEHDQDAAVEHGLRPGRGPLRTAGAPFNLGAPMVALLSLLLVTAVAGGIHGAVLDWLGTRVATHTEVAAAIGAAPEELADLGATDATGDSSTGATNDTAGASGESSSLAPPVRAVVSPRSQVQLALPWWLPWTALAVAVTILLAALAAATSWLIISHRSPKTERVQRAAGRSLATTPSLIDGRAVARAQLVERTGRAWGTRVLTEHGGLALLAAVILPTVAVVAGAIIAVVQREPLPEPPLATVWLVGLAAVPALAIAAVRTAREDRAARREFARLWDVLAFWPRLTHPFSPPSYGEALVPALAARIRTLTERGHPVVLGGHSQGSVVILATVLQLDQLDQPVHLLTYGSPLRLLYEGFFPRVFGGPDGAIARGTPHAPAAAGDAPDTLLAPRTWHNVMALTEPIGTPLWRTSVRMEELPDHQDRHSWDVLLALPWRQCPACGWQRPGTTDSNDKPIAPIPAIDITITDPDRLVSPAGEVDGIVAGHSSYHRSRELDLHLHHLAHHAMRPTAGNT